MAFGTLRIVFSAPHKVLLCAKFWNDFDQ